MAPSSGAAPASTAPLTPPAAQGSHAASVAMRYTADSSFSESDDFDLMPMQPTRPTTLTSRRANIPSLVTAPPPRAAERQDSRDMAELSFGSDSFGESMDLALPE